MATERKVGAMADCRESNADLTGKELYLCTLVAGGKVDLCGLGGKVAGVISEGKAAGLHSSFFTGNQLKAVAGATIAEGDKLSSDGAGKVRVAASTHWVFGTAKSGAASGEIVEFNFDQEGVMA